MTNQFDFVSAVKQAREATSLPHTCCNCRYRLKQNNPAMTCSKCIYTNYSKWEPDETNDFARALLVAWEENKILKSTFGDCKWCLLKEECVTLDTETDLQCLCLDESLVVKTVAEVAARRLGFAGGGGKADRERE